MPRVLILGGTDLTRVVAEAVLELGVELAGIVTVGNHFSISYSPSGVQNYRGVDLHAWCSANGVPLQTFEGYGPGLARLGGSAIDLCLVAGWYHMVPAEFRALFPRGCFGLHASLLPKLRGGAPLNWAILLQMAETGVSLFALDGGVDDGLVYGQARFGISAEATVADLVEASSRASTYLIRERLLGLLDGTLEGMPQQGEASYALQRIPDDGRIDWARSANDVARLVRAVGRPYPGAFSRLGSDELRVWRASVPEAAPAVYGAPGQIVSLSELGRPAVVTGEGLLIIEEVTTTGGHDAQGLLRRSSQRRFTMESPSI